MTNDAKAAGFVVVTTDKGLCGWFEHNTARRHRQTQGSAGGRIDTQAVAIGYKNLGFLNRVGAVVSRQSRSWATSPIWFQADWPGQGAAGRALAEEKARSMRSTHTKFVSTMRQTCRRAVVARRPIALANAWPARLGLHL
jgi:F-type H+-transporting ATPase subunit gamma